MPVPSDHQPPSSAGEGTLKRDSASAGATGPARAAADTRAGFPEELISTIARPEPPADSPHPLGEGIVRDTAYPAIPGYEILGELGRGGMGVVYKARQVKANRLVALKMIKRADLAGPDELARFRIEAQAVAGLNHPNIVQIYEVGEWRPEGRAELGDGVSPPIPFFSLEFIDGGSLAEHINRTPQSATLAACTVETLARAMQHAHERGIIHRDLKPANVLLASGGRESPDSESGGLRPPLAGFNPKIADFGLAKQLQADAGHTHTGQVMGTPSYMAPEQAAGRTFQFGPHTDIYALGVILYEMLTGRPPIVGANVPDVIRRVLEEEPVPPSRLHPALPRDLETICLKCLHKDSARRYPSARGLADDLRRYLNGEPIVARPVGAVERGWRWCKRKPAAASLLCSLVLGAVTALGLAVWALGERDRADSQAARAQDKTREAEKHAQDSRDNAAEAQRRLTESMALYVANGLRAEQEGDLFAALLWFAEPARRDPNAVTVELAIERLTVYWQYSTNRPRLVHLIAHEGNVAHVEFSPDGRRMVTAGIDKNARVWDAVTGDAVCPPLAHAQPLYHASFSPDGRLVVTASFDRTARIWDAATGKPVTPPMQHQTYVERAVFSPDGRRVVTVAGHLVQVWDAETGQSVIPARPQAGQVTGAVFSPNGKQVLSTSTDGGAELWEAETGAHHLRLEFPAGARAGRAAFSPDGQRFATAISYPLQQRRGEARLWDAKNGNPLSPPLLHPGTVSLLAFSPDGRRLATAGGTQAWVWDTADNQLLTPALTHQRDIRSLAFSGDGRRLLTASHDKTARVWDATSGAPVTPFLTHQAEVNNAAFSPEGRRIATATFGGELRVWDLATDPEPAPLIPRQGTGFACFSPDGRRVVLNNLREGSFRVWDTKSREPLTPNLAPEGGAGRAFFGPDGRRLLTVGSRQAQLWDSSTGAALGPPLKHTGILGDAAFSPDGRKVVTTSGDRTARIWDTNTGSPLTPPLVHEKGVARALFTPDGLRLVTLANRQIQMWDAVSGNSVPSPFEQARDVTDLRFSPDGRLLVTIGGDGSARIWDAVEGHAVGSPLRHQRAVIAAAFSADGRRLVTGSVDATARVWEVAGGVPLCPPLVHRSNVSAVAFSGDGRRVLTASFDGTARLWDASTGQPLCPPLQHLGQVKQASFTPDTRRLLTIADVSHTPWVWDLRPVGPARFSVQDWRQLIELVCGHRLDASGARSAIPTAELEALAKALREKHPAVFAVPPAVALAWHRRELDACIREENLLGIFLHYQHSQLDWAIRSGLPRW